MAWSLICRHAYFVPDSTDSGANTKDFKRNKLEIMDIEERETLKESENAEEIKEIEIQEDKENRKFKKEIKAEARKIHELKGKLEEAEKKSAEAERKLNEAEKKLAEETDKLAKEKNDYVRLLADFDNYRRRTAQERLDLVGSASEDTIKGLLPILDDFERAIKALEESEDSPVAKEGTQLIYSKLIGYLKSKGLTAIEAAGAKFDTDEHEAVSQFPVQEEDKKGVVFDVVQTGYKLNGKVIRFAKVVVGI